MAEHATHYKCLKAESNFYTTGRIYPLVTNAEGHKGFIGNDGRFDLKSMVVSKFIESTQEAYNKQQSRLSVTLVTICEEK